MLASSSVIKKTARTIMHGKWLRYIAVAVIPVFMTLACILTSEMFLYANPMRAMYYVMLGITGIFLLLPLYLGVLRCFWRMYMGVDDSVTSVFHYFTNIALYKRAMGLNVRFLIRIAGFGILFLFPAIIMSVLSQNKLYDFLGFNMPQFVSNFSVVAEVLAVLGITVTFFVVLRWYLAPFFLIADEEMEPAEAMHMSYVISKCTYVDFISLGICCIHWLFLSILVLPALLTAPYLVNIYLVHARFATAKYNQTIEQLNSSNTPRYEVG